MNKTKGAKRKHSSLSIQTKVEILRKIDSGIPVKKLCSEYDMGQSTVYDLKKQREKILTFYANADCPSLMGNRKSLHSAKNVDVDRVLLEWIRQRRSENFPLCRSIIMEQARTFHKELGLTTECDYSTGWFTKFKRRHGLRLLKISGEKASADIDAADAYSDELSALIAKENLTHDQIYNADETALFWRYIPRETYATSSENNPTGFKESKERITVLSCANAAGTHKNRLLVIGKSQKPRALKDVKILPVIYKANKKAWMTGDLFIEWFKNHFVPEARNHCRSVGLSEDCKILLILDNCSAHPNENILQAKNVIISYMPPNCTSVIQPMDQGIIRSLKCTYKSVFLKKMLNACNSGKSITAFQKEFNIRDALWNVASAWEGVKKETLQNAWHNVLPTSWFSEDDEVETDFEGFHIKKEKVLISELLDYAKNVCKQDNAITEQMVEDFLNVDKDEPAVLKLTDSEIKEMVLNTADEDSNSDSENELSTKEKIPIEKCIELAGELIRGMEQRSFFSESQIMQVYRIQETFIKEKPKHLKQMKLNEMFQ